MSNNSLSNNDVNGAGSLREGSSSGRCSLGEQRGPGRYPATARMRWSKEVNTVVMECFYRSKPFDENERPIRGYRQRMFKEWRLRGMFDSTEQWICDQARTIRKNGWLSDIELEMIKRKIEDEVQNDAACCEEECQFGIPGEEVGARNGQEVNNGNQAEVTDEGGQDMNEDELINDELDQEQRMIVDQLKQIMAEGRTAEGIMFKKVDRKTLRTKTEKVNGVLQFVKTSNITQTNDLIKAAGIWVAEQLGLKKFTIREKYVPRWKRRIEGDIKRLRREVNFMERGQRGKLEAKKKGKLKDLEEKYGVKRKGFKTVVEELKQRMIAKSAKVQRYEQRITQCKQNRLFHIDQKKLYSELNGGRQFSHNVPDADESRRF